MFIAQRARAGVAPVVAPAREARGGLARAVAASLPRGVLCVDEEAVHEEYGVLGRGPDVSHDGCRCRCGWKREFCQAEKYVRVFTKAT